MKYLVSDKILGPKTSKYLVSDRYFWKKYLVSDKILYKVSCPRPGRLQIQLNSGIKFSMFSYQRSYSISTFDTKVILFYVLTLKYAKINL